MAFDPILDALMAADPTLGEVPLDPYGPAPVDPYAQGPVGAPPPAAAPAPSQITGARISRSETDLDKLEAIQTGKASSRYDRRLNDLKGEANQAYARTSQDLAAQGEREKALAGAEGDLAARRAQDVAAAQTKIARQEMAQAADIQKITDAAWQKVNQAQTDYQGQLAAMRAARIDPKQFEQNSNGEAAIRGALGMALLSSNSPQMARVGQQALAKLDQDIKQDIDAQVQNLKKDLEVTEGFRAAWALASQNAVNEEQAKARVQGMILQAHKDSLSAEIATKYDSDLARAAAERVAMEVDKKILEADIKQREVAQKYYLDTAQMATQKYLGDQQAAIRKLEIAESKAIREAKANEKKSPKDLGLFPVADPETKEFRYSAKTEKGQEILDDLGASSDAFSKSMENLENYVREADMDLIGGTESLGKLKDSKDKKVAALARTVSFNLAKMLNPDGKISDADAQAAADSLSVASILTRDAGVEARDAIRNFVIDNTQSYYGQYAYDVNPAIWDNFGLPRHGAQAPVQTGHRAQANTQPPVTSKVEKASGGVDSAESRQERWLSLDEADRNWAAYVTAGGKYSGQGQERVDFGPATGQENRLGSMVRQPGWADEISQLGAFAADPRLPQAQRLAARKKLEAIKKDGENTDKAFYAKYVLDDLGP